MAATNKRGIFSLQDVKIRQGSGNWPTDAESFLKPPYSIDWPFGYYAGGPSHTGVSRLDLSNDGNFASIRGPIAFNSYFGSTSSSSSGGYLGGNEAGGRISSVCKIDYANDTATASPKGPYNQIRGNGKGVGNITYGWHCTGQPSLTQVDRIDYSNDTTTASPRGNLSYWSTGAGSSGNNDYGYIYHGSQQGPEGSVSHTDRIDYSNDTATSSPKGKLTAAIYLRAASGNADYGYCAGGKSPGNNYGGDSMARMDYANDTNTMSPKGPLSVGRAYMGSMSNSDFGYWGGGYNPGPGNMSYQDRLTFANDTATCVARGTMIGPSAGWLGQGMGPLTNAKKPLALNVSNYNAGITTTGASVQFNVGKNVFSYPYGYTGGGVFPPVYSTIQRIDFSNDTATASIRGPLSAIRYTCVGASNSNFGYFGGGSNGGTVRTYVDRIDFSNDNVQTIVAGPLATARGYFEATGNENYGWFAGGTGPVSKVERVDFSNDTPTASPRGNLMLPVTQNAAAGNKDYGWHVAGAAPPIYSTIQRIDYSNDTVTATQRGPLSSVRYAHKGSGNKDYGWFTGGGPGTISTVDRIDYSNDTGTTTPRGPLSQSLQYLGATSSANAGYYVKNLTVDKIDFSNDTAVSSQRGALAQSITQIGMLSGQDDGKAQPIPQINDYGTGAPYPLRTVGQQYGYFAGGGGPATPGLGSSLRDRMDYINDTTILSPRGNLVRSRWYGGALSSLDSGYFAGGAGPGLPSYTTIERLDYSNDTALGVAKGPLAIARNNPKGSANSSYGWFTGGYAPSAADDTSTVERVDFSNDTATASPRGNLSVKKTNHAQTGNQDYGYTGGRYSQFSTVDRIDYSNDTATAAVKGPLSLARSYLSAAGNANYGWFTGGAYQSFPGYTTVDRIDYSNDTATASPKGPLTQITNTHSSFANKEFGYFTSGYPGAPTTRVDRISFANDTVTAQPRNVRNLDGVYGMGASAAEDGLPQG